MQKYNIFYKKTEKDEQERVQFHVSPSSKKRSNNSPHGLFNRLAHEKVTIMFIPHSDAKNFHFHISFITILFFGFLFFSVLSFSVISFFLQTDIEDKAENLHKETLLIRKRLLKFQENFIKFHDSMETMKSRIVRANTYMDRNYSITEDYLTQSNPYLLFLNHEQYAESLSRIKEMQERLLRFGYQLRAMHNYLQERNENIYSTPSLWPTTAGHITSLYGYRRDPFTYSLSFHSALDIAAPRGSAVRSTAPGVVSKAAFNSGYGNYVQIQHPYGFSSLYAHNSALLVSVGQKVRRGQVIARVGRTGRATGDHVHYEVHIGNYAVNPYPYLNRY